MICTLFRLSPPNLGQNSSDALFTALRVWTDVEDISESEFFGASQNKVAKQINDLIHDQTDIVKLLSNIHLTSCSCQGFIVKVQYHIGLVLPQTRC